MCSSVFLTLSLTFSEDIDWRAITGEPWPALELPGLTSHKYRHHLLPVVCVCVRESEGVSDKVQLRSDSTPFLLAESSGIINDAVWNGDCLSRLSGVWLPPLNDHIH